MRNIFLVAIIIALFTACKNNSTDQPGESTNTSSTSVDVTSAPAENIKSVMYESETIMPEGMGTTTSKVYTDDFGKKVRTEAITSISFGGKSMNTTSNMLKLDDYAYTWSNMSKTGSKIKLDPSKFDPNTTDIATLTEEMKKKMNLKEEGEETIDGKSCKVFSFSMEQMNGKMWSWKGIPLKMEMAMMGKTVTTNVKKIEENPSIPAGTFELPSGIEFKEMQLPATAQH